MTDGEKIQRCRAILGEMKDHQLAIIALGNARVTLLRELRACGWGLGRLGKELGISRARVQQMTGPLPRRSSEDSGPHPWSSSRGARGARENHAAG